MTTLPPWSYSSLEAFEQCPRKYYHRYILKEKGPETEAQRIGNYLDKAIEERLKTGKALPEEFNRHEPFAASLYAQKGTSKLFTQLKMGLTKEFTPCGFFDANVWGRGVLDVALVSYPHALIADWKTGKNSEGKSYSNNGLQLKIFAALFFKHFPTVYKITAFNIWLKDGQIGKPWVFERHKAKELWLEIVPRILALEKAATKNGWLEKPSGLCSWCDVKACQFNKS